MKQEIYADGGSWDQYAGDDGIMCFDEANTMNSDFRALMEEKLGESLPEQTEEEF